MFKNPLLVMVLAPWLVSGCSTVSIPEPQITEPSGFDLITEYLQARIAQDVKEAKITGLSVALVSDQELIWASGFGYADKKNNVAATAETLYRAGSITKVFTALAAMKLHEQGQLDVDTPIDHYLPEFQIQSRFGSPTPITLSNLLNHHSGLPGDLLDGMWTESPDDFTSVIPRIRHYYLANPPGRIHAYSNLGYSVAGAVIEKQSGQKFEALVHQSLLEPMGMHNADISTMPARDKLAKAYLRGKKTQELPLRDVPAGGLSANVVELAQLLKLFNGYGRVEGRAVISEDSIKRMIRVSNENVPLDLGKKVGTGVFHADPYLGEGKAVVWHNGQTLTHNSLFVVSPQTGLGIVIMANDPGNRSVMEDIARKALTLMYQAKFGPGIQAAAANKKNIGQDIEMAGHYSTVLGFMTVEKDSNSDRYVLKAQGQKVIANDNEQGTYNLTLKLFGFIPVKIDLLNNLTIVAKRIDGVDVLVGNNGSDFLIGKKVRPVDTLGWEQYEGRYKLLNQFQTPFFQIEYAEFQRRGDFLMVTLKSNSGSIDYPIWPQNDREAVVQGIGRSMGETLFIKKHEGRMRVEYGGLLFEQEG